MLCQTALLVIHPLFTGKCSVVSLTARYHQVVDKSFNEQTSCPMYCASGSCSFSLKFNIWNSIATWCRIAVDLSCQVCCTPRLCLTLCSASQSLRSECSVAKMYWLRRSSTQHIWYAVASNAASFFLLQRLWYCVAKLSFNFYCGKDFTQPCLSSIQCMRSVHRRVWVFPLKVVIYFQFWHLIPTLPVEGDELASFVVSLRMYSLDLAGCWMLMVHSCSSCKHFSSLVTSLDRGTRWSLFLCLCQSVLWA